MFLKRPFSKLSFGKLVMLTKQTIAQMPPTKEKIGGRFYVRSMTGSKDGGSLRSTFKSAPCGGFISKLDMSISSGQLLTSFTRLAKGVSGLVPGGG